jgi:hypothetical protein
LSWSTIAFQPIRTVPGAIAVAVRLGAGVATTLLGASVGSA